MTPHHSIKKTFFTALCLLIFSAGAFATETFGVSDKLLQIFKQTFPDAQQVVWAEQGDKYIVNFHQGDILTKIEYDKDGNFLNSLRYYSERNLPVTILCRLQKRFADKTIFGVTEVATDSSVEYYIKLEDAKQWITVRSNSDGNLQVVREIQKGIVTLPYKPP